MASLSYKQRKKLSKAAFVFPGKKTQDNPAGEGAYPIPDIDHARNALARVAANGTPAEQAAVKAAVYAKFPQLLPKAKSKKVKLVHKK